MGATCFKSETKQRSTSAGELELSVRSASWSGSRSPEQRVPEAVQDLVLVQGQDCSKPSASLQWRPPANLLDSQDVSYYYIRISSKLSSQVLREIEVKGATTRLDFPGDEYLEPLHEYIFAVQAMGCSHVRGDWNMLDGVIEWLCRFPGCEKNRLKLEDGVYDFCSRDHKIEFDEGYCLYGDCRELAVYEESSSSSAAALQPQLVRDTSHFCSYDHYSRILITEPSISPGFFIEVKSGSPEYKTVEELFQKSWSSKERKTPPSLSLVLAVLNPSLEQKFKEYKQLYLYMNEKKEGKMVKKLFYGTSLGCDLHTYQVPCEITHSTECSTCDLALHGFGQLCKSGATLDKNPARSHEKAKVHMDSLTYALLLCDVACTNSKKLVRSASVDSTALMREGFDAVKVNIKSGLLKTSTDEVIVYKANAVCPRYILLYV